jgi:N-acetylglucosaminyl-diphospho-decaprenol L-rhamnosyltransferase
MRADVSLVLVTYRSSAVAPAAVASFRRETSGLGLTVEVVVVDHSEDPDEAARLGALGADRLLVRPNRGYAAGVNAGVGASTGRTMFVGNPDIVFESGSVAALLAALDAGWDVAGPQFGLGGLLFPPADLQGPGEELRRWLAGRSRAAWHAFFRRELARSRIVWEAEEPVAVPTLSGALLAFRREAFERVGPWDERYFLYYEETDWLLRAAARGLRCAQVPAARVEHLWGHAADPEATAGRFAESRQRFLAVRYGRRGRLIGRLRFAAMPLPSAPLPEAEASLPQQRLWWLLSPTSLGLPAAGLLGTAADLTRALQVVTAARRGRGRYIIVAAEAGRPRPVALWSWEPNRG